MIDLSLEFDSSFFEEEDRNGYHVSGQLKEIWAVELDLLVQFDLICKKYDLHYCVGAGTMLGAVRHKGFIPWDDDIDIYMPRMDYDKFCSLADKFHYPYFLQNSLTEKNLLRTYSRLRNSATTGHTKLESRWPINKGIFIDIFPLDGISSNDDEDLEQFKKNRLLIKLFNCFNERLATDYPPGFVNAFKIIIKKLIARLFAADKKKLWNSYEHNIKKYSNEDVALWGNRTLVFECPKTRRPLSDYLDVITMPFEFLEVPVPRNYDALLRQQYGDYMQIPEDKGGNVHGELIISTDYAYDDPRRTET